VEVAAYGSGPAHLAVADGVTGVVLVVCGVIAWGHRSARRIGVLMIAAGLAWFLGTLLPVVLFLHRGPLVHLHVSYPTGRLRRRFATATVVLAYIAAVVEPLARNDVLTLALAGLVGAAAVDVFARTSGTDRKAGRPALAAALAFAAVLALGAADRLAGWEADRAVLVLYDVVVAAVAILLVLDLRYGRWVDATVADLVVGLGGTGAGLRDQLARAMGDPTLLVGYWIPEEGRYVDESGAPVELPGRDGGDRRVTLINEGRTPVAVLVHDAAAGQATDLMDGVTTAARMALANARMRTAARRRAVEIEASRRRIVESADRQRRDLERALAGGAAARLADVDRLLAGVDVPGTDEMRDELDGARGELHDFAHGVRPSALSAGGLPVALPVLADRSPVPVELAVACGRLPDAAEACLYFVCSEALANIAKHAVAHRATVHLCHEDGTTTLTVIDDGRGGADIARGTGLRGLRDRVEALGGTLTVTDAVGGGTIVMAAVAGTSGNPR
jgi:signal transduction histidine kinase